ncbi:hypothetical protein ZIOFF_031699 [Zingiber officinale]|uniref:Uncharacterized protein n=1 Tax=Zingiber officinale TaxID=94328 RepID=A0A8J5LB11_ZINOF|nr:hypothetical protein ZIOFF_031699 [Zingiber officinale]
MTAKQCLFNWSRFGRLKLERSLKKSYITEEQLLGSRDPMPEHHGYDLHIFHFCKRRSYFGINSSGLDGSKLYPHVRCKTANKYLGILLDNIANPAIQLSDSFVFLMLSIVRNHHSF